jgi:hypothetical protein
MERVNPQHLRGGLRKRTKIFQLFVGARHDSSRNVTCAQTETASNQRRQRRERRGQNPLRPMRADHHASRRWATSYLQHLRDLQKTAAPKPRIGPVTGLARPKWPSAHATDSRPDQRSSAHGSQKFSHRFPGRGAPVGSASPALRAWPV